MKEEKEVYEPCSIRKINRNIDMIAFKIQRHFYISENVLHFKRTEKKQNSHDRIKKLREYLYGKPKEIGIEVGT